MATSTFTNATDYGPSDNISSTVTVTGMTASTITAIRVEMDWHPDPGGSCGSDAGDSYGSVTDPDSTYHTIFADAELSGGGVQSAGFDIASSNFPSNPNGSWNFLLEDYAGNGCNTQDEVRVIFTYTDAATGNPAFAMFVD